MALSLLHVFSRFSGIRYFIIRTFSVAIHFKTNRFCRIKPLHNINDSQKNEILILGLLLRSASHWSKAALHKIMLRFYNFSITKSFLYTFFIVILEKELINKYIEKVNGFLYNSKILFSSLLYEWRKFYG